MTNTFFCEYICKGPQLKGSNNQTFQRRVGVVVGTVEGKKLLIGWSLCNKREGDRYNPELALSLAKGRAITQNSCSLTYKLNRVVYRDELISQGVPQSSLGALSKVISSALNKHAGVEQICIFNNKKAKQESHPKPVWV